MEYPNETEAAPMPNVLMVFPRFNQQLVLEPPGARANLWRALPGAAARPDHGRGAAARSWNVRLVNRNTEELEAPTSTGPTWS